MLTSARSTCDELLTDVASISLDTTETSRDLEHSLDDIYSTEAQDDGCAEESRDRTVIDMEIYSEDPSGRNHLSVDAAYQFLSTNGASLVCRKFWNSMNETEQREFARHWHHMNRARRLDVLDVDAMFESCPQTDWMIRALMILLWEAQAGNHWASDTISDIHDSLLELVPDFYVIL